MLLEGRGSAACLVSSIKPEENGGGKILYCHERVAGVAMGLHIFKQTNKNQKKQRCTFYSIREAKLPFISKKMVFEKFEPGKKLSQQYVIFIHFKRKQA